MIPRAVSDRLSAWFARREEPGDRAEAQPDPVAIPDPAVAPAPVETAAPMADAASDELARQRQQLDLHDRWLRQVMKGFPDTAWTDTQFLDRLHKLHGPFKSTAGFSDQDCADVNIFYQHREKALTTLTAATSWYGGDYFEFGAVDLNTFRNMLSAFDLCRLQRTFPDTRFYAFDIFGKTATDNPDTRRLIAEFEQRTGYFARQSPHGDALAVHEQYLDQHNLFRDQCRLVQGYFQDTLTPAFKSRLKQEGRKIGYAFLDCNWPEQYKVVFEFIHDLMADVSYIYLDEYLQVTGVTIYFEEFVRKMRANRNMGCVLVRTTGSFGALFKLYKLQDLPPLELGGPAG